MERKDFLNKIALTLGVTAITPMSLFAKNEPVENGKTSISIDVASISNITMEGKKVSPAEIISFWKETGILLYSSHDGACPMLFNGKVDLVDIYAEYK